MDRDSSDRQDPPPEAPEPVMLAAFLDYHRATLRIMTHMIEETARHNGHADLLRESIDGSTGE